MIGHVFDGKRWLYYETVPDFLLIRRASSNDRWTVCRGYLGNGRIRGDGDTFNTIAEARGYTSELTGGLLSPWLDVSHLEEESELVTFARMGSTR